MRPSQSRGSFSGFVNLLRGAASPIPSFQPQITSRMLRRYLLHSGPATQILRAINWATMFVAMMVFGAAFYSLMISSDNKITAMFPMAAWGSTLLFGSGIVLMLLSIKGYYSVTKRSVKLLTAYYVIMQVVFVAVGILTLIAYVRLPDLLRDVRERCATTDHAQMPECQNVQELLDEVEDHVMLLVQCGLAVTVLTFLKSQATFGVVAEILLERCKYSATPFGMSPAYGSGDEDDWATDVEGGTPGGSVYGFPIRPRNAMPLPLPIAITNNDGRSLSRQGSQSNFNRYVPPNPPGLVRVPSTNRLQINTSTGYQPPSINSSKSPPSLLQQATTKSASQGNMLQEMQAQWQASQKAKEEGGNGVVGASVQPPTMQIPPPPSPGGAGGSGKPPLSPLGLPPNMHSSHS